MADIQKLHLSQEDWALVLGAIKTYVDAMYEKAGGDTTAVADTLNTLIGEDTGKTVRAISAEEVAKIVANADESFDTLKEIADWIMNDTTGAAKMANDIQTLFAEVGKKAEGEQGATGLYKLIADEVVRATGAENALSGRLDTIEGEGVGSIKKAVKDLEDGQVKTNKEAIEAINNESTGILKKAKDYADGLAGNYDKAGAAAAVKSELEAKYGEWATAEQVAALVAIFALPEEE